MAQGQNEVVTEIGKRLEEYNDGLITIDELVLHVVGDSKLPYLEVCKKYSQFDLPKAQPLWLTEGELSLLEETAEVDEDDNLLHRARVALQVLRGEIPF